MSQSKYVYVQSGASSGSSDEELDTVCIENSLALVLGSVEIRPYDESLFVREVIGEGPSATTIVKCSECVKTGRYQAFSGEIRSNNIRRHWASVHKITVQERGKGVATKVMSAKKLFVRFHIANNLPLCAWDKVATKQLMNPYVQAFGVKCSAEDIRAYVEQEYFEIKILIGKRLAKVMFTVQFDIATAKGRSVLGITITFTDPITMEQETITIGMNPISGSVTGLVLKERVEQCLAKYGLNIVQAYSYTTDNGRNCIKGIGELLKASEAQLGLTALILENENWEDDEIDDEEEEHPFDEAQIRCAAHTVQLAVHDMMKPLRNALDNLKEEVHSVRAQLKKKGHKRPPLSNQTRYVSNINNLA